MSDVKWIHWGKDLTEVKGGDYVLVSDYDALAADNARLAGELAEARRAYENATAQRAAINAECDALKNLANNLQPGPISEAMAGTRYKRESELVAERDALQAQVAGLREALKPMALVPVEDFGKQDKPASPLMGWNEHTLYVRDVLRARAALAAAGEGRPACKCASWTVNGERRHEADCPADQPSVDPDHCPVSTTGDHWVKTDIPGKCVYCGASVPTTAEGTEK